MGADQGFFRSPPHSMFFYDQSSRLLDETKTATYYSTYRSYLPMTLRVVYHLWHPNEPK